MEFETSDDNEEESVEPVAAGLSTGYYTGCGSPEE